LLLRMMREVLRGRLHGRRLQRTHVMLVLVLVLMLMLIRRRLVMLLRELWRKGQVSDGGPLVAPRRGLLLVLLLLLHYVARSHRREG
jgi:hypothetical protein